jgi:diguanylate cyclase (GGDEF)-like protein
LLSVSLVRAADGSPLYFVSQIQDITSRKQLEQQLEYQAHHDQLTGLLNRNGLVRLLYRNDLQDDDIVAVLVVDMDGFKAVNDGFGHHAGDRVLSEIASRIRACLRDDNHVARHGGDEFVVILNGPVTWRMAERVAGRIRASIAAPITLEGGPTSVSLAASIGIELGPRHQVQGDLMRAADDAMYRAKRERKAARPEQRA